MLSPVQSEPVADVIVEESAADQPSASAAEKPVESMLSPLKLLLVQPLPVLLVFLPLAVEPVPTSGAFQVLVVAVIFETCVALTSSCIFHY